MPSAAGVHKDGMSSRPPTSRLLCALRSLLAMLAMLAALVVYVLANASGSAPAERTGFAGGGALRLGWDLLWVYVAGIATAAVAAGLAPARPRMHVAVVFAVLLAIAVAAVLRLGADWPLWFSAGVLLGLPLQAWLGAQLVRRRSRPA